MSKIYHPQILKGTLNIFEHGSIPTPSREENKEDKIFISFFIEGNSFSIQFRNVFDDSLFTVAQTQVTPRPESPFDL